MANLYVIGGGLLLGVIIVLLCILMYKEKKYSALDKKTSASKDVAEIYNNLAETFSGNDNERFNNSLNKLRQYAEERKAKSAKSVR